MATPYRYLLFLGLSFWHSGRKKVAIKYLEEIDNEYNKTKKLNPNFRTAYEILIKYNDSIGNTEKQLEYINKLMALDKSYEKTINIYIPGLIKNMIIRNL